MSLKTKENTVTEEGGEEKKSIDTGGFSFDEHRNWVADEFAGEYDNSEYGYPWLVEIYDTFVVASFSGGKYKKIPYTVVGNEIEFADKAQWEDVRLKKQWLAKGIHRWSLGENGGDDNMIALGGPTIKQLGQSRLGFYGQLWGSETAKDLHEEYFDEETDGLTELHEQLGTIPLTFHHAADPKMKATVFGAVDVMQPDSIGLWCEAQITKHKIYKQYIQPLIEEEALYPSSETLVGAKKVNKSTGHIDRWVNSFMTFTPSPAEWRMLQFPPEEVKGFYKSIGVDLPDEGVDDDNSAKSQEQPQEQAKPAGVEKTRLARVIELEMLKAKAIQISIEL